MHGKRWLYGGIALAALLLLGGGALLYRPYLADRFEGAASGGPDGVKLAHDFVLGERTLVIAPHPDDETLGGGGVIEKAVRAGKQVKVVIVTTGDGYKHCVTENFHVADPQPADYRRLGEARHRESLRAMQQFGVRAEDVLFLGYPDGGVNGMWESNWDPDHLHLGLNGATRAPYPFAYEKNAPYCGANVARNLSAIIRTFQPTDIVYPDPNDQHHDHWATNAFVKYVLTELHSTAKEWTYLVHRGDFPIPWMYKPNLPLDPPFALRGLDTHWIGVPLDEQERQRKMDATCQYVTQTKVMDPFLDAFVRQNELLGTYVDPVLPVQTAAFDVKREPDNSPYLLFHDAYADTLQREAEPGADLTAVGALQANGQFYLGLEAKSNISSQIRYLLRARLFFFDGVQRFDLIVANGRLTAAKNAQNSLDVPPGSRVLIHGNRLWLMLPGQVLRGVSALLVSADTYDKQGQVDKAAWRLVRLPK